jgi:hypothetical protein
MYNAIQKFRLHSNARTATEHHQAHDQCMSTILIHKPRWSRYTPCYLDWELCNQHYNIMFCKLFRAKALCDISSIGLYYRTFKKKHVYSPYLSTVKSRHIRNILTRFRSGHR